MKYRLRRLARLLGAVLITVLVAVAAGAAAVYLTGSSGIVSCVPVPVTPPATADPIPRWVIAAGIPALVATLVGAFFALAGERVLTRLVGVVLTVLLGATTFYAVYTFMPAACHP